MTKKLMVLEFDDANPSQELFDGLERMINAAVAELGIQARWLDRTEGREALLSTFGCGPGE